MKTLCSMLCGAALLLPSVGLAASTAVLVEAVRFPVVMNGRQIGESTVQAGTTVEVLEQSGGRVHIKYGAAEPLWVEDSVVNEVRLSLPQDLPDDPASEVAPPPAEEESQAEEDPPMEEDDAPWTPALDEEESEAPNPLAEETGADGKDPAKLEITVLDTKVTVERWGTGETGVIFFSNSGDMAADIRTAMDRYEDLCGRGCSLFLWPYPKAGPFVRVQQAIGDFMRGGTERLDFTGVAREVLTEIKQQTGLQKFLLVGNSLGGGVILWDHAELAKDENVKFMLISPTEVFMPQLEQIGPMDRTALLAQRRGDDFIKDRKINAWIAAHRSPLTSEASSRDGHLIVGQTLSHDGLASAISNFLELPPRRRP